MTEIIVDLPAFNVIPPFGIPDGPYAQAISSSDGSTSEIVWNGTAQDIAIGNWGDGPGAPTVYDGGIPNMYPPDGVPGVGWVLTSLQYVAVGKRSGGGPSSIGSSGGFFNPPVTDYPSIWLDDAGSPDGLVVRPFDIDIYGASITDNDPYSLSTAANGVGYARARVWWVADSGSDDIHLSYLAVRLTYTIAVPSISGEPGPAIARFIP